MGLLWVWFGLWSGAGIRAGGADAVAAGDAHRPNIVFILADDLGATDLGCYGSRYYETPRIDRMAREGVRFTAGYSSAPNCQPTRAALATGQVGPRTGVYTVGSIERFDWRSRPLRPVDNVERLPLDRETVAGALKRGGYATGLFGKWHLGDDGPHHPGRRGYDEAVVTSSDHFGFTPEPPVAVPAGAYQTDWVTERAVDFLRRHRDGPFFLDLHPFAVHSPHQATPERLARFRGRPAVGGHRDPTYAAMIAALDDSVGRVLDTLEELGLTRRTLVVFTSDNGGVGGYRREGIEDFEITDNAPLRGGKGMLYEGGIRVPYLFRWPGRIAAGGVCAVPVDSVDLMPTLLDLASVTAPSSEKQPLDGLSYRSLLLDGPRAKAGREALFWHFPGYLGAQRNTWRSTPAGAIRMGDWKLLEFFETGKVELYHLRNDPGEREDLASREPAKAGELLDRLRAWRRSVGAPMPARRPESEIQPPKSPGRARAAVSTASPDAAAPAGAAKPGQ